MELGRRSGELVLHDEGEVCTRAARKARNTQHALQALPSLPKFAHDCQLIITRQSIKRYSRP